MQKEEQILQKRLIELSNVSYRRGIATFSDFLNLNELNILHIIPKNLIFSTYKTFGGYVHAERQMVVFLPDALCYDYNYPIRVLKIQPLQKKFSQTLSHRDYLGAILNLGIERSKLGDIIIELDQAYLFVHNMLADYVIEHLSKVKHTSVMVSETILESLTYTPKIEEITGTVPSIRLDCLLSLAYNTSRSKLTTLIESGKVYINGRLITTNAYQLKEEDIVSVRGIGRFSYKGILTETKKSRYLIKINKFI